MTPFDRKKAAEYLVVAWVKDWRISTYLNAIGVRGMNFEDIHDLYPWMPAHDHLHRYIKNSAVRPWVAFAMRTINDKLFDAKDDKVRLALAKQIEHWDSAGATAGYAHKEAEKERRKAALQHRQTGLSHKVSVETMRRGSGTHWNVCK